MSWEDQGRQYHQWFGHGTGEGVDVAAPGRDVAAAVGDAAVGSIGGAQGGALSAALSDGGSGWLREALPVWVGASGLSAERFGALLGSGLDGGAEALQAACRALAGGVSEAGADAVGAALAAGVAGQGVGRIRVSLRAGRDRAVYAARSGEVVPVQLPLVMPGPVGPPGVVDDPDDDRAAGEIARWLKERWASRPRAMEVPGFPLEVPGDAKDKDGAKAPGKPGEAEGFEDPKGGEAWVKAPGGRGGYGWLDKKGNVWVPTGWAGDPGSGTVGPAHGGPHWDVIDSATSKTNIYPGGRRR